MTKVKDINNNIISGTEVAYQTDKGQNKELDAKTFKKKWQEHKVNYISKYTTKEMVYENGSALALLYKEVQRLNTLLISNLKTDAQEQESKK